MTLHRCDALAAPPARERNREIFPIPSCSGLDDARLARLTESGNAQSDGRAPSPCVGVGSTCDSPVDESNGFRLRA